MKKIYALTRFAMALFLVAVLMGCYMPIRFDADAPRETPIRSASELSPIRRWLVGYRDEDEL